MNKILAPIILIAIIIAIVAAGVTAYRILDVQESAHDTMRDLTTYALTQAEAERAKAERLQQQNHELALKLAASDAVAAKARHRALVVLLVIITVAVGGIVVARKIPASVQEWLPLLILLREMRRPNGEESNDD